MSSAGAVVFVTPVGRATGSRAAAAALACEGAERDRAGLLVDLTESRPPRPALIATAAARELEERLAVHLPEVPIVSRGRLCRIAPRTDPNALDVLAAALPAVRGSVAVVHLAPRLLRAALDDPRIRPSGVLLRADLNANRELTALVARDLIDRELRVAVLKQPLGWVVARLALSGVPPAGGGLPVWAYERLLAVGLAARS